MKHIWNTFCDEISKNKGVKEMTFEKNVVTGFLQALGWSIYANNLEEQSNLYKGKWRPDFVFYLNGDKKAVEVILELKKPDHKQRLNDIEQIETYMKLTDCRFGLYFGEKLEIFYLLDKDGKRIAKSVTNIDWTKDNEAGLKLIELLKCSSYSREKLETFCKDLVDLKVFLKLWKTPLGQQRLYDGIIEHFILSPSVASSLKAYLKFTILDSPEEVTVSPEPNKPVVQKKQKKDNKKCNTWLICYDKKYFDVEGCFKKYGQIYWVQKSNIKNVKKGDIAYLYSSSPESAIRFKVEVTEANLPYSPEMDVEDEFVKKGGNNYTNKDQRFFIVRPVAETKSPALKHKVLFSKQLMGKRPSASLLSQEKYVELKEYIEENF